MGSTEDLFAAIEAGDADEVRSMVSAEPSLASARDAQGVSALMRARYRSDPAMLDAVLSGDPAIDVFEAASLGDVDRLRELLDADPSRGDGVLRRWVHRAAFPGVLRRRGVRAPVVGAGSRGRRARPGLDDGDAVELRGRGTSRRRRAPAVGRRRRSGRPARERVGAAALRGAQRRSRRWWSCCSRTAPTPPRRTTTARPCARWRRRAATPT